MVRYVMVSLVAVLISYIGIAIKGIYHRRMVYLSDYERLLGEIIEEISYAKTPLIDIISHSKTGKSKAFKKMLDSLEHMTMKNNGIEIREKFLKDRENKIIQNCFLHIGTKCVSAEIESLNNELRIARDMASNASNDYKVKGALISKLGILLAIALLILMV